MHECKPDAVLRRAVRSLKMKTIQHMLEQRSEKLSLSYDLRLKNVAVWGSIFSLRTGNARVGLPEKNTLADQVFA